MRATFPRLALLGLLSTVLPGCDSAPAPEAAPAMPAPKAPKVEAAAVPEQVEEFTYTPVGKRDPFRSFLEDQRPEVPGLVDASCGPLCAFELDQLRLVAVVSGVASPVAMVEDPQGRGHLIRRGTSIGKPSRTSCAS